MPSTNDDGGEPHIPNYPQMRPPQQGEEGQGDHEIVDTNETPSPHRHFVRNVLVGVGLGIFFVLVLILVAGGGKDDGDNGGYNGGGVYVADKNITSSDDGNEPDTDLLPPPPTLSETCTRDKVATPNGREACEALCAEAECCHHPTTLTQISCLGGNMEECLTYHAYCTVLHEDYVQAEPELYIPPAPVDIEEICSSEQLAMPWGLDECQNTCAMAECCYEDFDAIEATCADRQECIDYAICHAVKAATSSHPAIQSAVEDKCRGREDSLACETACSQAGCCFDESYSCLGQLSDPNFCDQYAACGPVLSAEKPTDEADAFEDFADACDPSVLDLDLCFDTCFNNDNFLCCESHDSAYCEVDCGIYQPCKILEDNLP